MTVFRSSDHNHRVDDTISVKGIQNSPELGIHEVVDS